MVRAQGTEPRPRDYSASRGGRGDTYLPLLGDMSPLAASAAIKGRRQGWKPDGRNRMGSVNDSPAGHGTWINVRFRGERNMNLLRIRLRATSCSWCKS